MSSPTDSEASPPPQEMQNVLAKLAEFLPLSGSGTPPAHRSISSKMCRSPSPPASVKRYYQSVRF